MPGLPLLDEKLRELALFPPTPMPVLSVYLNTQPDQHGRDNFQSFLRKELKAWGNTYAARSPEKESFEQDAKKIVSWVETELRPSSNGAALFACSGAGDFFEAFQFEAPIHENRLYASHQPQLFALARLRDEYPPYAAVIADTNAARIFVFGLGRTLDSETITSEKVRSRSQIGGWWLRRYQLNVENYHLRHAKEVLEQLDRIVREEGLEHIIFAGDEVIMHVLREQLSPFLAAKVVRELKLDITTAEHEIFNATLKAMREHDARTDAERVRAMIDDYRAGGLAVAGKHDVLAALANGQVDTVFVSTALEHVPARDEPQELPDTVVTRAEQTGAKVRFIEDPALLADVGGVGATLRYRVPEPRSEQ